MKKVIANIIFVSFFFIGSIASAETGEQVDDFDGSILYYSYCKIENNNSLQFDKTCKKYGGETYTLYLDSKISDNYWKYSNRDANIKLDSSIYNMKVISSDYLHYKYSGNFVSSEVELTKDLIEILKTAQKVSVRFYHQNGATNTIDIPDKVLAEWKQVIAMEK